jgi:hypothetical protein
MLGGTTQPPRLIEASSGWRLKKTPVWPSSGLCVPVPESSLDFSAAAV